MYGDPIPKGFAWRFARTIMVGFALTFALAEIGDALSFGGAAYFVGFLAVLVLATLTDRTDFYNPGPRPPLPDDRGPPDGGPF